MITVSVYCYNFEDETLTKTRKKWEYKDEAEIQKQVILL